MSRSMYLDMCEQLGSEPDEDEIPIEIIDLPLEAQEAWSIFDLLPDRFDSFSGNYYGKDLSNLINYYQLFDVDNKQVTTLIIRMFDFYETSEINSKIKNSKKVKKS